MTPTAQPSARRFGGNYWKLLSSATAANLGDGLMTVAVPWLASVITRDPLQIAMVTFATRLPWLLFSLPAGAITDRFDRSRLVAWMDIGRCIAIFTFAVVVLATLTDPASPEDPAFGAAEPLANPHMLIGLLYVTALLIGFAEVLRDNSAQTLLPSIVAKEQLERANGRLRGAETVMNQFVGPPVAGLLLGVGFAVPLFVSAGAFAVGAVLVFGLVGTFAPRGQTSSGRIAWRAEIGEGLRALWRHRLLRSLVITIGAINATMAAAVAVYILFAQEVLGLDARSFGLLLTGTALGAVLGSLIADRVSRRLGPGESLFASMITTTAGLATLGSVSSGVVAWVVNVSLGFAVVLWSVITVSLRQAVTPDRLLGRVNSAFRFFGWGTISLGTLLGGSLVAIGEPFLGREWALRTPFLMAAALQLLLLAYALPRINTTRIEQAKAATEREPGE